MVRGRTVGLHGNHSRQGVQLDQRVAIAGALATPGGVRGAGQTRLNVRGIQRGKLQNLPGELDGLYNKCCQTTQNDKKNLK